MGKGVLSFSNLVAYLEVFENNFPSEIHYGIESNLSAVLE